MSRKVSKYYQELRITRQIICNQRDKSSGKNRQNETNLALPRCDQRRIRQSSSQQEDRGKIEFQIEMVLPGPSCPLSIKECLKRVGVPDLTILYNWSVEV